MKKKEKTISAGRILKMCLDHPRFPESVKEFGSSSYGTIKNGRRVTDELYSIEFNRIRVRKLCREILGSVTQVVLGEGFGSSQDLAFKELRNLEEKMFSDVGAFGAAFFSAGMLAGLYMVSDKVDGE